jgi:hypothetical protein
MYFTELFQRLRARERKRGFLCQTWFTALRSVLVLDPEKALGRSWEQQFLLGAAFISIRKFGFCRVNCELMKY